MATRVLNQSVSDNFALYHGDACEVIKGIPDNSIGYSIFSPPFSSLYTYSNNERDMGNSRSDGQFHDHFGYLLPELLRVLMPGRSISVHCMDLPRSKERTGEIGLWDFGGQLIRVAEACGFILHSKVVIWKDPVTAMQRTKALGLLWKQIKKDSSMSRMGIPDYLVTLRKPGKNPEPVKHTADEFPVSQWQKWASPVWDDINPSDTLQYRSAREEEDERHICPLQLQVIQRGINLWSNRGDRVLTPFGGIGSEPYTALELGRKAVAVELKKSYYDQMVLNCQRAELKASQQTLFGGGGLKRDIRRTSKASRAVAPEDVLRPCDQHSPVAKVD